MEISIVWLLMYTECMREIFTFHKKRLLYSNYRDLPQSQRINILFLL